MTAEVKCYLYILYITILLQKLYIYHRSVVPCFSHINTVKNPTQNNRSRCQHWCWSIW